VWSNFFSPENRAFYEIMWKNNVEWGGAGHRWQYAAFAFHAGYLRLHTDIPYVIITVFQLQEWLQERASVLRWYPLFNKNQAA